MSRLDKITAILLVAVLLACPFFCLSGLAAGHGCCTGLASHGDEHCPCNPTSCAEGGACVCHGAVTCRHVEAPDPQHTVAAYLAQDDAFSTPQALAGGAPVLERTALFNISRG